jgi:hypothetical protein
MADFIIKPASGDTLKLQDEGGDDAISISTTGVSTIANATITAGTFPAGHVIGVQQDTYSTTASTSGGYVTGAESSTYTIKKAGSTIYVDGHFQWRTTEANSKIKIIWSNDGFSSNETQVSLSSSWGLRHNSSDIEDELVPFHEKIVHGGAVGSTVKVRVQVNDNGGSGVPEVNGNDSARIRLMEVT